MCRYNLGALFSFGVVSGTRYPQMVGCCRTRLGRVEERRTARCFSSVCFQKGLQPEKGCQDRKDIELASALSYK